MGVKNHAFFFKGFTDKRVDCTRLHSLRDIIGLMICAMLSDCNDWEEIALYGKQKQAWLKGFLPFNNGIPSHDNITACLQRSIPRSCSSVFSTG